MPLKLNIRYPRSFLKLLSVGFALVAVPLLVGLIGNAVAIRQISQKSQQAVYQAARMTQESRVVLETLNAEERAARQYWVLGDLTFWESYAGQHQRFDEAMARLRIMALTPEQQQEIAQLAEREGALFGRLEQARKADARPPQGDPQADFALLEQAAQTMLANNNALIGREIEALKQLTADAERRVYWQLLALIPAALFLVAGFTHLLSRPIAQIEAAIGGLWRGRFERKIEVGGPSDLQALGEQLDRLRLRLVELEEQKSRFLRHISHELKTPLAALREGADLLGEEVAGPLTPAQKEITGILVENSLRLRRLIEDLLDYSAAEFDQSALRRQPFPLRELIESVVETQRLAWAARGLEVSIATSDVVLNADRERVRTVVDNLLSNAIKYSATGGKVSLAARQEGDEAVLEVCDDGPGIAADERELVFDPFYQGRAPGSAPVKSSGLGLSIAREHVLAHGGRIALLPGEGARFEVRLPI